MDEVGLKLKLIDLWAVIVLKGIFQIPLTLNKVY